jgi:hypothetical protein
MLMLLLIEIGLATTADGLGKSRLVRKRPVVGLNGLVCTLHCLAWI